MQSNVQPGATAAARQDCLALTQRAFYPVLFSYLNMPSLWITAGQVLGMMHFRNRLFHNNLIFQNAEHFWPSPPSRMLCWQ